MTRPQPLLTIDEAAEFLGTKPAHIRKLIERRHLAFVKVGKYVRFRLSALEAFVAEHEVPAS